MTTQALSATLFASASIISTGGPGTLRAYLSDTTVATTPTYLAVGQTFANRASTANYFNSSGNLTSAAVNISRVNYNPTTLALLGTLVEPASTNYIANNTQVGAVVGTPGTYPTGWSQSQNTGLTFNVIGTGTEEGIPYIDLQLSGTAAAGNDNLLFPLVGQGFVFNNQTWTMSAYFRLTAGSFANMNSIVYIIGQNTASGGTAGSGLQNASFMSSITGSALSTQQITFTATTNAATIGQIHPSIQMNPFAGAINFTLRIGGIQVELGSNATSLIQTSGTIASRSADYYTTSNSLAANATVNASLTGFLGANLTAAATLTANGVFLQPLKANTSSAAATTTAALTLNVYLTDLSTPATPSYLTAGQNFYSRASTATYFNSAGIIQTAAANVLRTTYNPFTLALLGNLVEPAALTGISNSTAVGAVVGTPGTMPNSWTLVPNPGETGVVGNVSNTGTINGMPFIDITLTGTANSGGFQIWFDQSDLFPALAGQTFCISAYMLIEAGSLANITSIQYTAREEAFNHSTDVANSQSASISSQLSGSLARPTATVSVTNNNSFWARTYMQLNWVSGSAINVTIRIANPQIELGIVPTSPIQTSGTPLTRAADYYTTSNSIAGNATIIAAIVANVPGSITATTRKPTASFVVNANELATVTAAARKPTTVIASQNTQFVGALAAITDKPSTSVVSQNIPFIGSISATTRKTSASFIADVNEVDTISATTRKPSTTIVADVNEVDTISAKTRKPTTNFSLHLQFIGVLAASAKRAYSSIASDVGELATVNAGTKKPVCAATGEVNNRLSVAAISRKPTSNLQSLVVDFEIAIEPITRKPVTLITGHFSEIGVISLVPKKAIISIAGVILQAKFTRQTRGTVRSTATYGKLSNVYVTAD